MNRKLISAGVAFAMVVSLSCPVFAAWQPSKTVQELGAVQAAVVTEDGTRAEIEIALQPSIGEDQEVVSVKEDTTPYILVTPLSETQAKNAALDADSDLSFAERAAILTETGLTYSDNEKVNLIFDAVTRSSSTTEFLEKVGGGLLDLVTEAVNGFSNGESGQEVAVDDFAPVALFDVTASAGALEMMGENGSVEIQLEVPGIKEDSSVIAIHFLGEVEDMEAAQEALENNFESALLNYDAELLDVVAGEGAVTVTMNGFSPVLIMTQVEDETGTAAGIATPEPTAEPAPEEPVEEGSGWVVPAVVAAIVVVAVAAVVVTRKNKETTTTAGKK